MGLYSGELIIGTIFASEVWRAYFREGLFGGTYYRNFTVYGIKSYIFGDDLSHHN